MKNKLLIAAFLAPLVVLLTVFVLSWTELSSPTGSDAHESVGSSSQTFPTSSSSSNLTQTFSAAPGRQKVTVLEAPISWTGVSGAASIIKHSSPAALSGTKAAALVEYQKQYQELHPNQVGEFDQIRVAPQSTLHISLAYPQGDPGDTVNLEVEDGGSINGKGIVAVVPLGPDHQIHFDFKVNQEDGIYRVEARNGGDVKMLNFWVDPKS